MPPLWKPLPDRVTELLKEECIFCLARGPVLIVRNGGSRKPTLLRDRHTLCVLVVLAAQTAAARP